MKKWQITQKDLLYEESRISTCKDYLKSLSSTEGIIEPAFTINTMSTFKLNSDDMIVNTLKQHQSRSKRNYALMLLTNDPDVVLIKRFRDAKKRLKNSNKNMSRYH